MSAIPDQAWWNYYVTLDHNSVIYLTNSQSPGFDPVFSSKLGTAFSQRLFGFANYNFPAAGSNQFPGNSGITNGPTKS